MTISNTLFSAVKTFLVALPAIFSTIEAGHALVDVQNANYSNSWLDVSEKLGVSILRTYNSRSLYDGMFGFGWCSDLESSITLNDRGYYELKFCGGGYQLEFTPRQLEEDRSSWQTADDGSTLEIADQAFIYRSSDGHQILQFDRMGQLSAIETPGFGTVRIIRRYGVIAEIADWEGRIYLFSTSSGRKVLSIRTPDALLIEYRYSQYGDLTSVRNAWKNVYTFSYDDLHNLVRATWPDKTFISIKYDKVKDWVVGFVDREKCEEHYNMALTNGNDDVYWGYVTKHCGGKPAAEGLYEFVFTKSAALNPGRLWKTRISRGLPGSGGITFTETVYPEFGPPIVTHSTRGALHTPLLVRQ